MCVIGDKIKVTIENR